MVMQSQKDSWHFWLASSHAAEFYIDLFFLQHDFFYYYFFKLFSLFLGCGQRPQEEQICLQDTAPSQELEFIPLMNVMIQTPKHLL